MCARNLIRIHMIFYAVTDTFIQYSVIVSLLLTVAILERKRQYKKNSRTTGRTQTIHLSRHVVLKDVPCFHSHLDK